MRAVLVSSFPAFPTTAGNRSRIRRLALSIRELGYDLTFVLLASKWEACDDAAHQDAFGPGKYLKITRRHWHLRWARDASAGAVKRVLRMLGVQAAYYSTLDRFRDRSLVEGLVRLNLRPDVVVVEYVLDSWAFAAFPEATRRVLDTHDAFADRHRGYVARGISDYWVSLCPRSENAGFRRADVVLAIQEEEARRFQRQLAADGEAGNPQVAVVGHLLELGSAPTDCAVGAAAVFLASDNAANRHAFGFFVDNVLPRVLREQPAFDLKLAGSICAAVPDLPNVTKLGWVDDIDDLFAQAPLSINPMLAGTGINIKLLDAMAAGVPTVSTATGVRGLPPALRNGVVVVPDDDPQAFAAAVVRLAGDARLRQSMGSAAREDARGWLDAQLDGLKLSLSGRAA